MYQFRYQVKRLRNMAREWLRLTKLYTTKSTRGEETHLQFDWRMNNPTDPCGRAYRIVDVTYEHRDPSWHPGYVHKRTEHVKVPRDLYDQIADTISDIVGLYWNNIFKIETCSHPHDKAYVYWDGEEDYGYTKQYCCSQCGGYMEDESEVDRYLPPEDRHPELMSGDRTHPFDRPGHKFNQPIRDDENDMHFEDDYID